MPLYLIKRNFGRITDKELQENAARSKKVCIQIAEITWVRSYMAQEEEDKVTYCVYEAPNADILYHQAREAKLPIDQIIPLEMEIDPAIIE